MSHIFKPSFLPENIEVKKEALAFGEIVKVVEFEDVDSATAEKVPNNFVLKQYKPSEFDGKWAEVFEGDNLINHFTHRLAGAFNALKTNATPEPLIDDVISVVQDDYEKIRRIETPESLERYRLNNPEKYAYVLQKENEMKDPDFVAKALEVWKFPNIARRLQERNRALQDYFSACGLPDLIVPTNVIIGEEEDRDDDKKDNQKHIYEIQPKIDALDIPESIKDMVYKIYQGGNSSFVGRAFDGEDIEIMTSISSKELADFLNLNLNLEQLNKTKDEISLLIEATKDLQINLGKIPFDMFLFTNMMITTDGLRLIDTNRLIHVSSNESMHADSHVEEVDNSKDFDGSQTHRYIVQQFLRTRKIWEKTLKLLADKV